MLEQRFTNSSSKSILIGEVSRNWMALFSLNEEKLITLLHVMNNFNEINNFFMNNYQNKIGIFVKLMRKVSMRWKNWSDFKALHSLQLRGDRRSRYYPWTHRQDSGITKWNNCMNDSRDFQDAESVRSGISHVPCQTAFVPPFRDPDGMLSRSMGMPSRNERPPSNWDTHGISGNVFVNPTASSSTPYPSGQGINPWISRLSEHTSPHVMNERHTPNTTLDPRCQSELNPWGTTRRKVKDKNKIKIWDASQDRQPEIHSTLVREDFQRIMKQTNNDCRFRILILTNSPRQQHSLVGRWDSRLRYVLAHNFLLKLCIGSKKWSWLIQWMM